MRRIIYLLELFVLTSTLVCCDFELDGPTERREKMKSMCTLLLGNNTSDTLVMIYVNHQDASSLYYHEYDGIETDSAYVKDVDSDNKIPFWNETDSTGRYLHYEIMAPFSNKHVLPGILIIDRFSSVRYYKTLPDSLRINPLFAQIGVVRYSDFEKYNQNKKEILESEAMEFYEFYILFNDLNPKDAVFVYNGTGNIITYL